MGSSSWVKIYFTEFKNEISAIFMDNGVVMEVNWAIWVCHVLLYITSGMQSFTWMSPIIILIGYIFYI